jgi:hypothetical protein
MVAHHRSHTSQEQLILELPHRFRQQNDQIRTIVATGAIDLNDGFLRRVDNKEDI